MPSFLNLNYVQTFQQLPTQLYSPMHPMSLSDPKLVIASPAAAALLDLNVDDLYNPEVLPVLSGKALHSDWQPIAMKYTGHQFGYYNPDLGDGRGLLLTEVENSRGQIWDLHLKGAGLTPYSRQGDGRAVLRSSIREFLCSEYLAAINVPTTRALSVVDSTTPVYRETVETGAMLIRVARTHIRFGHLEYCSFTDQHDLLKSLCDYTLDRHYPDIEKQCATLNLDSPYTAFFKLTVARTAKLIAQWQSIGFAHGVMNTDNMSILGETFDFGPFAFLDDYNPHYICNHSDHQRRYAFNKQPDIAYWNLSVLAQALLPLIPREDLVRILGTYPDIFKSEFHKLMKTKLGLVKNTPADEQLIKTTLDLLQSGKMDYSHFFRHISDLHNPATAQNLRNQCLDIQKFDQWKQIYLERLASESQSTEARILSMNMVNPKYILRNYLAQNAISAAQSGDYSELNRLFQVLQDPYSEQPEHESYAELPPNWGKELEISCSS